MTADGCVLRIHFLIYSFVGDTPEEEDLLSVKRGVQTRSPFNRSPAYKEDVSFLTNAPQRCLRETQNLLEYVARKEIWIHEGFDASCSVYISYYCNLSLS